MFVVCGGERLFISKDVVVGSSEDETRDGHQKLRKMPDRKILSFSSAVYGLSETL